MTRPNFIRAVFDLSKMTPETDKALGKQLTDGFTTGEVVSMGYKNQSHCEWKYDDKNYCFDTSCRHSHQFMYDGIKENNYEYCPYCGMSIEDVTEYGDDQ